MKVVHFNRKPREGNYSIEQHFDFIRKYLSNKITIENHTSKYFSNGIVRRTLNIINAALNQGDVNHITGDVTFLNLLMTKRKNIITVLDCGLAHHKNIILRWLLILFWLKIPVKRARFVITISQATKDELVSITKCDESKVKVIYVSVSPNFKAYPKEFNTEKPIILQIGTKANKNLERLIQALDGIKCHLDIVGKLSETQKKLLGKHNISYSNSFNLSESKIIEKYNACDIVSLISIYEGFGMPIIEGNAFGRLVITAKVLSMPEIAGQAACVVNPYSIQEIREGILKILNSIIYRDELVINGIENVKRFSLDLIAGQYLDLYKEVYESNNGR